MGYKEFLKNIASSSFLKSKRVRSFAKWILFGILITLIVTYTNFQEIFGIFSSIPLMNFLIYIIILSAARFLYAYRWKIINNLISQQTDPKLTVFFSTNLLAEFFSIAIPSSLGGEALRYLKINPFNKDGVLTTLAILIDRVFGIGAMILVSIIALLLMEKKIQLDIENMIPSNLLFPLLFSGFAIILVILFILYKYLKRTTLMEKLHSAMNQIIRQWKSFIVVLLVSIISHIIFALAHIVLFQAIHPLPIISIISVILTPQLARSIPISLFGVSGGEGLMVFGQLLVGLSQSEAIAITALTLLSRYFFAFFGLLIELLEDGTKIFKKTKKE